MPRLTYPVESGSIAEAGFKTSTSRLLWPCGKSGRSPCCCSPSHCHTCGEINRDENKNGGRHSKECMCRLRNIARRDYQESLSTGQTHTHTHTHTHTDRQTDRQTLDKVIPMCRFALQATQKWWQHSKECMRCLQNINEAMFDYQESVTTGQTDTRTDRHQTKWSLCCYMLCRRHKNYHREDLILAQTLILPVECMRRLQNIHVAMCDYQESVTTGQTDRQTVRHNDRQKPDKIIPMCPYMLLRWHKKLLLREFDSAKHRDMWLPWKVGYQTDRQMLDKMIPICRHNTTNVACCRW